MKASGRLSRLVVCGAAILGAITAAPAPGAQPPAPPRDGDLDCLIQPREVVAISSPVDGIIDRVAVDRGDRVREGEVLITLERSARRWPSPGRGRSRSRP
jgi:multidrug efflux pump subunit AcrA (membrane-fusion protein)